MYQTFRVVPGRSFNGCYDDLLAISTVEDVECISMTGPHRVGGTRFKSRILKARLFPRCNVILG